MKYDIAAGDTQPQCVCARARYLPQNAESPGGTASSRMVWEGTRPPLT